MAIIGNNLSNLCLPSDAKSRSISPENFDGKKNGGAKATEGTGKNCARDLGEGWKISPSIIIDSKQIFTIADIKGPGSINQIWMTPTGKWRNSIIRIYWDNQNHPSVECPIGDFFACGWNEYCQISSLAVCVNPGSAFNCYWEMPFKDNCKITIENRDDEKMALYYQINYSLLELPNDILYFHASFRRENPLEYKKAYTLLDNVSGKGQYVGTYMAWGVNNNGWWGEGEIKFYLDDDTYPTICGTGTEDYFCGSYNFENQKTHTYQEYTTPYAGMPQVIRPDGTYQSQMRFGLYRWHITDPIRFDKNIKVTIQALGWRSGGRYLPLQDDISSVSYWYQTLPSKKLPKLANRDFLEII